MMPRPGEGYVSQTELLFTAASVGITDYLSLYAGTFLPALIAPEVFWPSTRPYGLNNFYLSFQLGSSINEVIHVAGGSGLLKRHPDLLVDLHLATITVGNPRLHVSFTTVSAGKISKFECPYLMTFLLSANAWLYDRVALVTQNWFIWLGNGPPGVFSSLVLRIPVDRWTFDLGAIYVQYPLVLPWLDIAFHWG